MTDKLDLRLDNNASVWDAWTYGCMKNCPRGPDCPCLPYRMGDVPNHYPVPATMDNAIIALFNQPEIVGWSIPWMKRELRR